MAWSHYQKDPQHRGLSDVCNVIYFGSDDYYFYALNPDGTLKWKYYTGKVFNWQSPVIGKDGTVYALADNILYALNPDGTLKWQYTLPGTSDSTPAIGSDGVIYINCYYDKYLYAINPDGTLKWKYYTGFFYYNTCPVFFNNVIYVPGRENTTYYLFAINPNGTLKWKFEVYYFAHPGPAVAPDGTIYWSGARPPLYAINPDGTLKWTFNWGTYASALLALPTVGPDGVIYLPCFGANDTLLAINPDGTLKWYYRPGTQYSMGFSSVAIDKNGIIYFGVHDGYYFFAINPDGTLRWKYRMTNNIDSSPVIGPDGVIYVGCDDFFLYALNPDGTLKWKYKTGGAIRNSPALYGILGKTYTVELKDYLSFRDINKEGYSLTGKKIFRVYYLPLEYKAIWDIMMAEEHNTKIDICKNFLDLIKRVVDKLGVQPSYWNEKKEMMEMIIKEMKYVSNYPIPPYVVLAEHTNKFVDYVCAEWTNALSLTKEIYDLFKQKTGKTLPYVEKLINRAEKNAGNLQKYKFGDKIFVKDHNLVIDTLKYLEVALLIIEDNITT
jgi:outer membrane protein assembly factor BamB